MTPSVDAILHAALLLPPESRAALAEKLLESLDEGSQKEIDEAWAQEAESRIRAFEQGVLKAIPGSEVLPSVRLGKKP
jgi:putative addiction module component (TIGR02574 family)